jgi:hypothetical protein
MNISNWIVSLNEADAELAMNFSCFLLRYNREIDYQDFSDDLNI